VIGVVTIVAEPDPGSGAFLIPRSGIRNGLKLRIRIRDEPPGSYFREFKKQFFGLKYLNSLMWIRDPQHWLLELHTLSLRVKNLCCSGDWRC
jgi:hypothetical protein